MLKYLSILALGLCACGGSTNLATPPQTAHATPRVEVVLVPSETKAVDSDNSLVDLELSRGRHAQALRCSDNLSCLERVSGMCSNGYSGGEFLTDGTKVVGLLFHCITDEEKAAAEREAVEEARQRAEYMAAREAQIRAAQEAAQKGVKHAPAKK